MRRARVRDEKGFRLDMSRVQVRDGRVELGMKRVQDRDE